MALLKSSKIIATVGAYTPALGVLPLRARMFDLNGDGNLGLSEGVPQFSGCSGVKPTAEQFNAIFTYYDKDGNGYIDEQELEALLRDLYEKNSEVDTKDLTDYKRSIMALSDGGKLYRSELGIVLCQEPLL